MKKILVTGATGFVGAALTRRLVKQKFEVHVFVREKSDLWRIEDISKFIHIHVVDLRNLEHVKKIMKDIRPNIIYHCATHGGFHFQTNTLEIIESNFLGTVNLLLASQEIDFDYFVNTGSSSEYGIKNHILSETDLPVPIGDYAVSKVATTLYCQSLRLQKELPIVTLRLFSPYGPWDAKTRFIPYVIKSFLEQQSPKVSTPESVRDYIYIDDVVEAYLKFLNIDYLQCDVINIGSGNQVSLKDVVKEIRNETNSHIDAAWGSISRVRNEPTIWKADISLAKNMLNWSPKVSLEQGLINTVDWIKKNITNYEG